MYSLQLSSEQLEIRDTVRDFVTREVKPVALKADRLDVRDRSLLMAQIDAGSQLGLRTLALSEERGGAGNERGGGAGSHRLNVLGVTEIETAEAVLCVAGRPCWYPIGGVGEAVGAGAANPSADGGV